MMKLLGSLLMFLLALVVCLCAGAVTWFMGYPTWVGWLAGALALLGVHYLGDRRSPRVVDPGTRPAVERIGVLRSEERKWGRGSLLLLVPLFLVGCARDEALSKVKPPEVVTVTVVKFREFPAWATKPLPVPVRKGTTVEAHLDERDQLNVYLRLANCHRALLLQLGRGEAVDPKTCGAVP